MKLQHLRFFVAAVDSGGIVKASERLSLSQPAVTAGLKALERELGQPLFEPAGRGRRVRPTAKAMEFYKDAREILRQCAMARGRFASRSVSRPKLRVGLLPTIATRHVAGFTRALATGSPELQLQLREGSRTKMKEWLRGGQIDVAWTIVEGTGRNTRQLWRESFVVLLGRTHRLAANRRRPISWQDLEGEHLILRGACEMPRGSLWPESLRLRVVARAERDELALGLVAAGLGIAVAPGSLATEDVVARSVHELETVRSIGAVWRSDLDAGILTAALEALSAIR
jgi:DNA-binding transcriptional LysR family regulator